MIQWYGDYELLIKDAKMRKTTNGVRAAGEKIVDNWRFTIPYVTLLLFQA